MSVVRLHGVHFSSSCTDGNFTTGFTRYFPIICDRRNVTESVVFDMPDGLSIVDLHLCYGRFGV